MTKSWDGLSALCISELFAQTSLSEEAAKPQTYRIERPSEHYLTEEILRNARPMELPSMSQEEFQRMLKERRERRDLPQANFLTFGVPDDADVSIFPYNDTAKLFVWFPETPVDKPESCSAQFVGSPTVILTAAHCLRRGETGVWVTNYVFYRGYRNGSYQQRVSLQCPAVMTGWVTTGGDRYRWDYAFIKTQTPSASGYFGLNPSMPPPSFEAIGYPGNFGGTQRMQKVSGARGTVLSGYVRMDGNPFGGGINGGASGGAWHVNGVVMGNNSRVLEGMWSPLYDSNVTTLWRYANNGCTLTSATTIRRRSPKR